MDESHLLAAVRYVELNPVRAALCDRPTDWRWSSVHAHLAGADDKLVTVSAMQDRIVDWPKYLSVADSDADLDKIRRHTLSGQPIGDSMFLHKIEQLTGRELAAAKPTPSRK
jgi:putative transposase